jgi:NADPH-dependent 2,4-dienoyl-CoA reductase/sulfur reductase-like enzyme
MNAVPTLYHKPPQVVQCLQERNLRMSTQNVVIVGAGHAGGELATALRENGWNSGILLVGQEAYLPYQRPPPSKTILSGETAIEGLFLKPQATYAKARIDFTPHTRVECIDRSRKVVRLVDGQNHEQHRVSDSFPCAMNCRVTPG